MRLNFGTGTGVIYKLMTELQGQGAEGGKISGKFPYMKERRANVLSAGNSLPRDVVNGRTEKT